LEATLGRDSRMDGFFFYAVVSTGVYCVLPAQPTSAPVNVVFFASAKRLSAPVSALPALQARYTDWRPSARRACQPRLPLHRIRHRFQPGCATHPERSRPPARRESVSLAAHLQVADGNHAARLRGRTPPGSHESGIAARRFRHAGHGGRGLQFEQPLYERAASQLGMAPRQYRNRAAGVVIRYAVVDSALGKLLIAGTEKGVCAIRFGDTRAALEKTLRDEFAQARLEHDPHSLKPWTDRLRDHLGGNPAQPDLPLDIQATAFQRLVWEHLRTIPRGQTESYSEVARRVGRLRPRARWRVPARRTRWRWRFPAIA